MEIANESILEGLKLATSARPVIPPEPLPMLRTNDLSKLSGSQLIELGIKRQRESATAAGGVAGQNSNG